MATYPKLSRYIRFEYSRPWQLEEELLGSSHRCSLIFSNCWGNGWADDWLRGKWFCCDIFPQGAFPLFGAIQSFNNPPRALEKTTPRAMSSTNLISEMSKTGCTNTVKKQTIPLQETPRSIRSASNSCCSFFLFCSMLQNSLLQILICSKNIPTSWPDIEPIVLHMKSGGQVHWSVAVITLLQMTHIFVASTKTLMQLLILNKGKHKQLPCIIANQTSSDSTWTYRCFLTQVCPLIDAELQHQVHQSTTYEVKAAWKDGFYPINHGTCAQICVSVIRIQHINLVVDDPDLIWRTNTSLLIWIQR